MTTESVRGLRGRFCEVLNKLQDIAYVKLQLSWETSCFTIKIRLRFRSIARGSATRCESVAPDRPHPLRVERFPTLLRCRRDLHTFQRHSHNRPTPVQRAQSPCRSQ